MNNNDLRKQLLLIQNGDLAAFEELYQALKTPIFTIVSRIRRENAEEILQEVFIKLYRTPLEPSIKNPRAYIFRMARNLAIDNARKQTLTLPLDEISEASHTPHDNISLRMDIDDALAALPSEECQIVTLHVIGGLKFREIAEVMEMPLGTVLWRHQKALGKLRSYLGGHSL